MTDHLTDAEAAELRALLEKIEEASDRAPRPWRIRWEGPYMVIVDNNGQAFASVYSINDVCHRRIRQERAQLITSAVNALPALLDELEALRARVEAEDVLYAEITACNGRIATLEAERDRLRAALLEAREWLDEVCNPDNEDYRTDDGVAVRRRIDGALGEESGS